MILKIKYGQWKYMFDVFSGILGVNYFLKIEY